MSLLSQLLHKSSKTELVGKNSRQHAEKKYSSPEKISPVGEKEGVRKTRQLFALVEVCWGVLLEASNWIRKISPTARDVHELWSVREMEAHRRSSCRGALVFIF